MRTSLRLCVLSALMLLSAACGAGEPPAPEIDFDMGVALYDGGEEAADGGEPDPNDLAVNPAAGGAATPVRWGTKLLNTEVNPSSPILQYFLERFNASMSLVRVPYALDSGEPVPDIFYGEAMTLYAQGFTRAIPRDMIEIYAPDYAALLSAYPYGWEMGRVGDTDEYAGLYVYDVSRTYLKDFSAYRLDWMERLDIQPPGPMTEVMEGVYFTPDAFTQDEFMRVMRAFSANPMSEYPDAYTRGIELYLTTASTLNELGTVHDPVASLMGMWGINLNNINENGRATPYFISEAYQSFLYFLRQSGHFNDDLIIYIGNEGYPRGFPVSLPSQYEAGWSSLHLDYLPFVLERQANLPDKRYLITPPEIGPDGARGGAAKSSGSLFDQENQWVINGNVSDATLIKILEIWNAMSFDPETYVTAAHGIAGTDFTWEGEAYNSRVRRGDNYRTRQRNGVGMFEAYTNDGNARKPVYYYGDGNPVYNYAVSDAGKALVLWPYKDDLSGRNAAADKEARIIRGHLNNIARDFYYTALFSEEADIAAEWDAWYMDALYEAGLQTYLDYLESCEVVTP